MTETVPIDRPRVANRVPRQRSAKPATVSASALALHTSIAAGPTSATSKPKA